MQPIFGKSWKPIAALAGASLALMLTPTPGKAFTEGASFFTVDAQHPLRTDIKPGCNGNPLVSNCKPPFATVTPGIFPAANLDISSFNDTQYNIIGYKYVTTNPGENFSTALSSSNIFQTITLTTDPVAGTQTLEFKNGVIAPGQYFNVSRVFAGNQPGETSTYTAFISLAAVPESSSLLGILAFGALGTVSLVRNRMKKH